MISPTKVVYMFNIIQNTLHLKLDVLLLQTVYIDHITFFLVTDLNKASMLTGVPNLTTPVNASMKLTRPLSNITNQSCTSYPPY